MFGIPDKALDWVTSYLPESLQSVGVNGRVSSQKKLHFGLPHGSVLGPILSTLYTQPMPNTISNSRRNHDKFADDTQLHKSSAPSDLHSMIVDVEQCVDSVGGWMTGHRLP